MEKKYPETRYMGSKEKLAEQIVETASGLGASNFLDLFSGSGVVSYAAKKRGFAVHSNDHLRFAWVFANAMVENNAVTLPTNKVEAIVNHVDSGNGFVEKIYTDLFYAVEDTRQIDRIRNAILSYNLEKYEKTIAMAALVRACLKKRPRGIFTYTGMRYDDGRRDLSMSIEEHFREQVNKINEAIFDNKAKNTSSNLDYRAVSEKESSVVYLDPPYYSPASDNHYVRRYHFVEGLARNWEGVEIQEHTKTKKFANYRTPFSSKVGAEAAIYEMIGRFLYSPIILSYSSNSLPTREQIEEMFNAHGRTVQIIDVDHIYSFSTRATTVKNRVKEFLFVSPPIGG